MPGHHFGLLRTPVLKPVAHHAFLKMLSCRSLKSVAPLAAAALAPLAQRGYAAKAQFDLAVIGSGPGGYVAAIKAAQLGLKVWMCTN